MLCTLSHSEQYSFTSLLTYPNETAIYLQSNIITFLDYKTVVSQTDKPHPWHTTSIDSLEQHLLIISVFPSTFTASIPTSTLKYFQRKMYSVNKKLYQTICTLLIYNIYDM